ncbi:recQ-mediated genome instability protein 1 [Platichthys flesus]|uniref:recQ-mediated genome instability protein 1 n=1 Tax=Platichthys flesus TaxID=8260 RepID=UPI002DB6AFC9|nr:recQ-mediated genome instability protein 1 [Platichthys flesus]XP_062237809.1 recQ-mediated genome instability protein 1 [Platichthys flesus]XP_062237810.1 recQ-mediated genome instability protein 1 [Platichthys flesus]
MAPEIQTVVRTTQAWLKASRQVQVPFAWLEACVEWLQEEAGGAGRLSQQQINQQALDQWLMTDLRDLDYPALPEGLAGAQKTELSGTFCVQVDSLLDVSQPAYVQLQKLRGTDCVNDEVSAVTQTTQRSWEARPTRMLVLQVTDGVQSLEAIEYQPIPAFSAALRPGAKLQLQGRIVCRLGMLLLGPSNVKVLGGEVEDLVDRNKQGRVLCRTLGLPEEQQQPQQEEAPPAPQQVDDGIEDLELDDAALLASLEDQEEVQRIQVGSDSGYGTHSEPSTQFSRSSLVGSFGSTASSRSEASIPSYRGGLTQRSRGGPVQGQLFEQEAPDLLPSDNENQPEVRARSIAEEDFPDEDFDDLPLDELDSVLFQETTIVSAQSDISHRSTQQNNSRTTGKPQGLHSTTKPQTARIEQRTANRLGSQFGSDKFRSTTQKRDYESCNKGEFVRNDVNNVIGEDMDCSLLEEEIYEVQPGRTGGQNPLPDQQGLGRERDSERKSSQKDPPSDGTVSALTLTSPPFTYLCLLEDLKTTAHPHTMEIRVKAFIVTLSGKLSSSNGGWSICASISDGTDYLDVELSDRVLTGLLGFSVAEKASLKRDPARRGELDAGMKRCQEGLVDMCCVMTIVVPPEGRKAVVTKAEQVSEKVRQELEQRARGGRKVNEN